MKKSKRMTCILLTFVMMLSMLMCTGYAEEQTVMSSAAGSVGYIIDKIDFSSDDTTKTSYAKGDRIGNGVITVNAAVDGALVKNAPFGGKSNTDKYVDNPYKEMLISRGTGALGENDCIEISFDYSPKNTAQPLKFYHRFGGAVNAQKQIFAIICSQVDFFGKTVKISPALNVDNWYNIKLVIKGGNGTDTYNKMSVYINGTMLCDEELTNYATNMGITNNNYVQYINTTRLDLNGVARFDNLFVKEYRDGAVFNEPVKLNNSYGKYEKTAYVRDMTVAQFTEKYVTGNSNIASCEFVSPGGEILTGADTAAGNYWAVKTVDDQNLYIKLSNNINRVSITKAADIDPVTTNTTDYMQFARGIKEDAAELYGRVTDGKVVSISPSEDNSTQLNIWTDATAPATMEFYALPVDGNYSLTVNLRYTNNNVNVDPRILQIGNNRKVWLMGNAVHDINFGEWIKFEMTVYPNSKTLDFRINGTLHTVELPSVVETVTYYQILTGRLSTNTYIDDLKVYAGIMSLSCGAETEVDTSKFAPEMIMLDGNISLPYFMNVDEMGATFENLGYDENVAAAGASGVIKRYITADGAAATSFADGNRVVFENDGVFSYYTLNVRENAVTSVPSVTNGKLRFIVDYLDDTMKVMDAKYINGIFSELQEHSVVFGDSSSAEYIEVDEPTDGAEAHKLLIWENMSNLKPLSGATEY